MSAFPAPSDGPILVVPGAPGGWEQYAVAAGWTIWDSENVTEEPWELCGTIVRTEDATVAGVTLARSGSVALTHSNAGLAEVIDDARRAGASIWPRQREHSPVGQSTPHSGLRLQDETDRLLEKLAEGMSVAQAAQKTHMSLRTAQRRLSQARVRFGVRTTPGAVAAWMRARSQ